MRRGLIARSLTELPDAVFDARLKRVRETMQRAQLDALIVYTNNTRPAGVSWLAGFVPYWSEALLVVPREGATYLVAALSFRVKSWIERVSRLGEVLHTPRIGLKAAQQIAAVKSDAAVGIVDFDGLAAGIAADLHEGGPSLILLRCQRDVCRTARQGRSGGGRARSEGRGNCSPRARRSAWRTLNAKIATVESAARDLGAEEAYIAAAPDLEKDSRFFRVEGEAVLGKTFALRATVAYKGTWVRLVRSFCERQVAQQAAEQFAQAVAQLPDDSGFSGFRSWLVEGCRMAQPLDPLIGSRFGAAHVPKPGALVSVQGVLEVNGRQVAVGAPALLGDKGEAASLLVDPLFD